MKAKKSLVAAVAAAAMGGGLLLAASPASAAAPTWEPDSNSTGSIAFFDASGKQVTSGSDLTKLFSYAEASTAGDPSGFHKASLEFAYPDHNKPNTADWFVNGQTASSNYPNTTAPAPVNGFTNPVATVGANEMNLTAAIGGATLDTTAGYANIVQVRLAQGSFYWAADISYNTTTHTWRQVYPVLADTTTTTLTSSVNPINNSGTNNTSTTLTATVQTGDLLAGAGTVQFDDGGTNLGTPVALSAGGVATKTFSSSSVGAHTIHATFIPADSSTSGQAPSNATLAQNVQTPPPADTTQTAVGGSSTGQVGSGQPITATVTDTTAGHSTTVPSGTVQFALDGTSVGGPVALSSGVATFQYTPADTSAHKITASYTPSDASVFAASSDPNGITVTATAPAYTPDPQNVTVNVPAGTLIISTPYTVKNPFNLGTLVLNSTGTQYSATKPFGSVSAATAGTTDPGTIDNPLGPAFTNGVTITDTRANSQGWKASIQAGDFADGGGHTIDGNNLTFDTLTPHYLAGNNLQSGDVTVAAGGVTAFKTAAKQFASTAKGPGTVGIGGNLTLVAPTSTVSGQYTATVTFTVV